MKEKNINSAMIKTKKNEIEKPRPPKKLVGVLCIFKGSSPATSRRALCLEIDLIAGVIISAKLKEINQSTNKFSKFTE